MGALVIVALGLGIGAILGWVAFFMALSVRGDINELHDAIKGLRRNDDTPKQPKEEAPAPVSASPIPPAPVENPPPTETIVSTHSSSVPEIEEEAAPSVVENQPAAVSQDNAADTAISFESRLAGNWLIWLGGAALVLGGIFLVKAAADAGFFGPIVRIIAALLAGSMMIAAGQWAKLLQNLPTDGVLKSSIAAPVLAGSGGATIYGAIYAAYGIYELLPPIVAFALLLLASAGMVVLAVIHRTSIMAVVALVGAHLSPVLASSGEPAPAIFFVYVYGVSIGGLLVGRIMRWRSITYLTLAGAFFWPMLAIANNPDPTVTTVMAVYLPAFVLMAAAISWDSATPPISSLLPLNSSMETRTLPLGAFYLSLLGALILSVLLTLSVSLDGKLAGMFCFFNIAALALAHFRPGFSLAPIAAIIASAIVFAFAPVTESFQILSWGIFLSVIYFVGGLLSVARREEKAPYAIVAAFGPIAILTALFYAVMHLQQDLYWAVAAFALTATNLAITERIHQQQGGTDAAPGAASAFALATALAATLAVAMIADGLAMSTGFALQAPLIVWLWRRFKLPVLKYAALALGVLASARLFLLPNVLFENVGATPIFNWLIPAYLLPAIGFWLSARLFEGGGITNKSRPVQIMEGGAIALFTAFTSLEIRHLFNAGELDADYTHLLEITLQSMNWIAIAAFMRWRFGKNLTSIRVIAERILIALAVLQITYGPLSYLNPWWGSEAPLILGAPIFNELLLFYLTPAFFFAAYAVLAQRTGADFQARILGVLAALLGYVWLILSIRHSFQGADLSVGRITNAESWSYSVSTIIFASGVLIVGAFHRSNVLRYSGLGALMFAVGKVFVIDMAGLEGVWRATSFLGLGAALVGIALLYQRVLSPMMDEEEESD